MFQRAIATLGNHVAPFQDEYSLYHDPSPGPKSNSAKMTESLEKSNWKSRCTGMFAMMGDNNVSVFPSMTSIYSGILHLLKSESSYFVADWPPPAKSVDRKDWIISTTYPILPKGRESAVALARLKYPLAHMRIPMMGRGYLDALYILSGAPNRIEESSLDDGWYLPDVHEFVDFTSDTSHTFA